MGLSAREKIILGLIAVRKEKGLTTLDVFNDTGVHIGRVESKCQNITIDTFFKLLEYYKVDVMDFIMNYCKRLDD